MAIRRAWACLAAALLLPPAAAGFEEVRYDDHAVVRTRIETRDDVETMRSISARLFSEGEGPGLVDWLVPPQAMAALEDAGIPHRTLIPDVQVLIDAERQRLAAAAAAGGPWFDDYKDYDAVNAKLDEFAADYPELASPLLLGTSLEGRAINGIRITGPGADKPAVLINGCQHAREWISVMVTMYVADRLLADYATDPLVQDLVDDVEFLIVPVVNPDGYVYTWGPDRLWRKNRRDNGNGTFGVDLNRNWGYEWGGAGSSGNGSSETYRGPAPFSEPETQALRDFYLANPQIVGNIDFHSYSQLVLAPWGYTDSALPPDHDLLDALGAEMASSILSVHGQTYVHGPAGSTLYLASGISIDWTYGDQGVFSYTIELRDTGAFGFLLPPEQIIPNAEEVFPAVLDLGEFVTEGVHFDSPGLPEIVEAQTPAPVTVEITPVTAALEPGTAALLARAGTSEPFAESPLTALSGDLYEGMLPAAPCGGTVQFYFQVETTDGALHHWPADAPATVFAADAFEIDVAFADDFETDLGWTVDDSGLTDGSWERDLPVPSSVCDRGNPGADADGSGQCYLTDNSSADACNSDVDGGTTTLTSPLLDASSPDAALSYWRWYSNSVGADPFNDVFVVEVSDDGGATWSELETVGPGGPEVSGGWFHREFLIADLPGVANTDQLRVRFHASDLGGGSVVEAGVDGVMVRRLFCGCVWDLDGDGAVGVTDFLEVLAQWGTGGSADFDGDGLVGVTDLLDLLANWGACP